MSKRKKNSGRLAVAMDTFLRQPGGVEALNAARFDQLPAHVQEACRRSDRATYEAAGNRARSEGRQLRHSQVNQQPEWLTLSMTDTLARLETGEASTCAHNLNTPQTVTAAAWKPGLVTCTGCTHLFNLPRKSEAARRCDRCGRITAGGEDRLRMSRTIYASLVFMFGLCGGCHDEWVSTLDTSGGVA